MTKNTFIATWKMAKDGVTIGHEVLSKTGDLKKALSAAICDVENNPEYTSVGYGGLPNQEGKVQLDAAYMDGDDLSIGAVMALEQIKNPIKVAMSLNSQSYNNILVGKGAKKQALLVGEKPINLLTKKAKLAWKKKKKAFSKKLVSYDGHDTVGMVVLNSLGHMACGVSTSGLFMKKDGRVGDSPFVGSGYYVDSNMGGAVATGVGEDIMKGCISFEIVRMMQEGLTPQEACEKAVLSLHNRLSLHKDKVGDISVVCLNNKGEYGAASNIDSFEYVVKQDNTDIIVAQCPNILNKGE
jgi:N4-(beta-N-acetylglucosaminyl)-L-asparaginase